MNKKFFSQIVLLLTLLAAPSCKLLKHKKSKKAKLAELTQLKKIDSLNNDLKTAVVDTNAEMNAAIIQYKPIWSKRNDFKTLSAKAKVHYENAEKTFDFVANFRIQKDSIIWVSVSVAGLLQVARAVITPDSFKAVLYTEREAYQGSIARANQFLPSGIDFYSLQNLLLGERILKDVTPNILQKENAAIVVRSLNENYIEQSTYNLFDTTMSNTQLFAPKENNKSLSQVLSSFVKIDNYWLSSDRRINVTSAENRILIEMGLSNLSVNSDQSYPFSIPQNYTLK